MNSIPAFNLSPLAPLQPLSGAQQLGSAKPAGDGAAFKDMLLNSIQEVNGLQQEANKAMESFAVGGDVNPVEVLSAVQKADLAFRMMMQVRNKLVAAYQEVQNIRV